MTDDDKALVERLRAGVPCCDPDAGNGEGSFFVEDADETMHEAADRIEALSAENERLREALDRLTEASSKTLNEMVLRGNALEVLEAENKRLREALGWFLNDSRFVVQVGGNPNVVPQMIESARAALGDTK